MENKMVKFVECPEEDRDLRLLEKEGIVPKPGFPYVWKVGNKELWSCDIEVLYKLSKIRKEEYEKRIEE